MLVPGLTYYQPLTICTAELRQGRVKQQKEPIRCVSVQEQYWSEERADWQGDKLINVLLLLLLSSDIVGVRTQIASN